MKFFSFVAGFFRNAAPESSTRLVGIAAFFVGLALAGALLARSCAGHEITWTDIIVVAEVLSFGCVALGLRSPFPPELFAAAAGVKLPPVAVETQVTASTTVTADPK